MNNQEYTYDSLLNVCENNKSEIDFIRIQYLNLLSSLTIAPYVSTEVFMAQIHKISNMGIIMVSFKVKKGKIILCGSGTIIYEPKIIHGCKNVGHIEDIVVLEEYRSNGISKMLLKQLIYMGEKNNCYKIILDCKSSLVKLYENNGFKNSGCQMELRL
jgi:glucosamine-phosphate N-acetyltransferase